MLRLSWHPFLRSVLRFALPYALAWCWLILLAPMAVQADSIVLSGERVDVRGPLSWLEDPEGRFDAPTLLGPAAPAFQSMQAMSLGYRRYPVWIRLKVVQADPGAQTWFFEVTNPLFEEVTLYLPDPKGDLQVRRLGEEVPRSQWDMPSRTPIFRLSLPQGEHTLLLRLWSRNSLSSNFIFWREAAHDRAEGLTNLGFGIYLGLYTALLLFQLVIWRHTRSGQDGFFMVYILLYMLTVGITNAVLQQHLALSALYSDTVLGLALCLSVGVTIQFMLMLLESQRRYPRFYRSMQGLAWSVAAICSVWVLAGRFDLGLGIMQALSLGLMLAMAAHMALMIWRAELQNHFLILAFGLYFAGVLLRFLRNLGLLDPGPVVDNLFQLAVLFHMLIISIGFGARQQRLTEERAEAQAAALQATRQLNSNLEARVAQRTAELSDEIERRKELESNLRRALDGERAALQQQQEFVAMVSHEFRTPLAIIDTTLQQLENNPAAPPERTQARYRNAEGAIRRITRLIDEYLSHDRIQASEPVLHPRPCDLGQLLQAIADEWPAGRIALHLEGLPAQLSCDPGLLDVAVRNLINNADRYAPPGTPIELAARQAAAGKVQISVRDHGVGIPPEDLGNLFRKYFRGHNAMRQPGAGLGLYMVERIARLHGGQAWAENLAEGGCRFTIELPTDN